MPGRSQPMRLVGALLGCVFAAPALAQTPGATSCEDLSSLALSNATISVAERVTGGSFSPPNGTAAGSVRARANGPVWPAAAPLVGIGTSGGGGLGWTACAAARRR